MPVDKAARLFGTRESALSATLSPDGKKVAYIGADKGAFTVLYVVDLSLGTAQPVIYSDGRPFKLADCDWSANDRLVCENRAQILTGTKLTQYTRLIGLDADGRNAKPLGTHEGTRETLRPKQFDGRVVDWLDGTGAVLIMRDHVPEQSTGTMMAASADGFGVDRVETRSLRATPVERARGTASDYISDGHGNIRIMTISETDTNSGLLTGKRNCFYRTTTDRSWRRFSDGQQLDPVAVDAGANAAYALMKKDGREALYRVALDGSMKTELVYANPQVDVDNVVKLGRGGRVIGATYVTDRRQVTYFDATFEKLAASLSKALPNLPLINVESASADENILLLRAASDNDSGHFYIYDRPKHSLHELMMVRPELQGETLATVRSITYPAPDGTLVPAYLTLPPGSDGKGLPALVMPHGGPAARDEWGFDWLAQFFASRGYAVIQPEFRGSTGYGDAWFLDNGFRSWRTAIGDVVGAGNWLVKQGIADPAHLAILGWSYGGYAALQSNALDPGLFKAVVAIAPATDLRMLRTEAEGFTDSKLVQAYIGVGPHLTEGSPVLSAGNFRAPVLMFHGDQDTNVAFAESAAMDAALRRAGKQSQLVRYPGLDHYLDDSAARIDMLTKADAFLRASMKM